MSLKKFISGISAFAVAATAFAAMAVTASAKDYNDMAITPGTLYRVKDNKDGTFKTADNSSSGYSGVIADLSGLKDIDKASKVKVEFDTYVTVSGGKTPILVYGVGDKSVRGLNGANSGASNYVKTGLVTYFGSEDGSTYKVSGDSTNYGTYVQNKTVHATVQLDREKKMYTCILEAVGGDTLKKTNISTTVDNLTVIEAITWGTAAYEMTFKNIEVSYTVKVPTASAPSEVTVIDNVDDDGVHVKAFTSEITCNGNSFNKVKVEVGEQTKELSLGTNVTSGSVSIGIILASKKESSINSITPDQLKVTASYAAE